MPTKFSKIIYFDRLESSSDYLINLYKKNPIQTELVVVANNQTKGRGRMGKSWFSDKGSLTFSCSISMNNLLHSWHINMAVSLALIKVLDHHGIHALIKYPNDIIVNNKKIAGILNEVINVDSTRYCILGLGLNINNELFPQNISRSVSMQNLLSQKSSKIKILTMLLSYFNSFLQEVLLNRSYVSNLHGFKNHVSCICRGVKNHVKILSVTKEGFLTIETIGKEVLTVNSVDIKFLLN
tara:strand:+ start:79 stop:795 length:717 start_codon:yes stop_codon:yes gene_type:complete